MEDSEKEIRRKEKDIRSTFFRTIKATVFFAFKLIKTGKRIISIAIFIFLLWFGYNFYNTFSELRERGMGREQAAIEAFTFVVDKTKNQFNNISKKIPSLSFFTNEYSEREDIRNIFIETRGIPEAYLIIVSYDEIKEGVPVKRSEPIWFEVWFYGEPYNKKVIFENRFFKEERSFSATDEFINNNISPLFFNERATKNSVQAVFGTPTCTISEQAGDDTLTTYRFKETSKTPLAAVTFVNEKIIAVSSGIVFLGDNEKTLCK